MHKKTWSLNVEFNRSNHIALNKSTLTILSEGARESNSLWESCGKEDFSTGVCLVTRVQHPV